MTIADISTRITTTHTAATLEVRTTMARERRTRATRGAATIWGLAMRRPVTAGMGLMRGAEGWRGLMGMV